MISEAMEKYHILPLDRLLSHHQEDRIAGFIYMCCEMQRNMPKFQDVQNVKHSVNHLSSFREQIRTSSDYVKQQLVRFLSGKQYFSHDEELFDTAVGLYEDVCDLEQNIKNNGNIFTCYADFSTLLHNVETIFLTYMEAAT